MKKRIPNKLQLQRIILLAEHLKNAKPQEYPVDQYCIKNKAPYYLYESGLEFKFPKFVYSAMEDVFMYE